MLIYHTHPHSTIDMKKDYIRKVNRKTSYSCKSSDGGRTKQSKVLRKDKISKKNVKFLEGLGLKVNIKHPTQQCS